MNHGNGQQDANADAKTLLQADDLRMSYGARRALRGLSFNLKAGRVLGFLGPNGAGKTTSIRILTTMLKPTSGRFTVDGISSDQPQEIRRRIGVLPEGMGFPKTSTGLDYLTFFGQLFGRPASQAKAAAQALLHDVGMEHRGNALIGSYSHGMRQRLGIARALVNDPAVIFLDEPTLGLDPRGQQELLALIRRVPRERTASVVLSSHLLLEIEGICDDVVIMNSGTVVAKGAVNDVIGQSQQDKSSHDSLRIRVPAAMVAQAQNIIQAQTLVRQVTAEEEATGWLVAELNDTGERNGHESEAAQDGQLARNKILEALIQASIPILGIESMGGRLQDVFLKLTAESIG